MMCFLCYEEHYLSKNNTIVAKLSGTDRGAVNIASIACLSYRKDEGFHLKGENKTHDSGLLAESTW